VKRSLAKSLALALNVVGAGLLFYGLRQISDYYEKVYEIASTGASTVGAKIADFPPTITFYFGVIAAAGFCWWMADRIRRRQGV